MYPVEHGFVPKESIEKLLEPGMELFVEEVHEFCQNHMASIRPQVFFEKLLSDPDVQIPLIVVLADPKMKDDIVVKAYEALRKAVENKYDNKKQ